MTKTILTAVGFFFSCLSIAQSKTGEYERLQEKLSKGWNTWSYQSMMSHVLLPEALVMKVNFRHSFIGTPYDPNYLLENITVDKTGLVRPVAHSFDGSYTELLIENWYGNSVRVQSASTGNQLVILVTPLINSKNEHYTIELETGFLWNKPGTLRFGRDSIVAVTGDKNIAIRTSRLVLERSYGYLTPSLVVSGDSVTAFYTGAVMSKESINKTIELAEAEYHRYAAKFGDLASAFEGIESVLGWNTLYDNQNRRVVTPVTRGWNEAWQGYVLFEWDTYFAALLFGVDNKELAYSNAIAISRGEERDHVGFWQMPGVESSQSQPPIGSMVCWKLYSKFQDRWFIEEVYEDLKRWNEWWIAKRVNRDFLTFGASWPKANVQDGSWESGLDNSPMYEQVHMESVGTQSLFNLADVGLNSLYAADCGYLAEIAKVLGKSDDERAFLKRQKHFKAQTGKLWNESSGIYLNAYLDSPAVSHRLTPTLFYPMIANVPSQKQAGRILKEHYYNTAEFYGENIIPSCAKNDKSFDNNYWRGSIWGPMNFLVYLGLKNYDQHAAEELSSKSYSLYMKAWNNHHYVFENINSEKGVLNTQDQLNCDPFYHWGALMGLMKFMEEKKY